VALGRTVAGEIVRRVAPVPTPLRRGAAAVVVTGGALSLAGVAAAIPLQADPAQTTTSPQAGSVQVEPGLVAAAALLTVPDAAQVSAPAEPAPAADELPLTGLIPVGTDTGPVDSEQIDTAALVKAVQLAERATTRATEAPATTATPEPAGERANGDPTTEPGYQDPQAEAERRGATEKERAGGTAEPDAEEPARRSTDCDLNTSQLGAVRPHVRSAAQFLGCRFGEPTILGVAGRGGASDHPSGKALDFMVDRATGNAIANCALRDQEALGVSYVIWRQRINFGEGWKPMADRGGVTANHFDHVHVSFNSSAGGRPRAC